MAEVAKRALYLSFDGIMQPLGWSQIVRLLRMLSLQGVSYSLVSLERAADLADKQRVRAVKRSLTEHGIQWFPIEYAVGGARAVTSNLGRAATHVNRVAKEQDVELLHARSYQAAAIAWMMKKRHGFPYVFDIRGYWIDERRDDGRWFSLDRAYQGAKRVERTLFQNADAIVSLTDLAANDVRTGAFGEWPKSKPVVTIPTCADYEVFKIAGDKSELRSRIMEDHKDSLLIGFVGSVNVSYRVSEAIELFCAIRRRVPEAHLLCATENGDAIQQLLNNNRVAKNAYTIRRFTHEQMPDVVSCLDWGFLLLSQTFAKRASMPTKLAEFFAAGVRPIASGCNEELQDWVRRATSGVVTEGQNKEESLENVLKLKNRDSKELLFARETTESHFSLRSGVARYSDLLQSL